MHALTTRAPLSNTGGRNWQTPLYNFKLVCMNILGPPPFVCLGSQEPAAQLVTISAKLPQPLGRPWNGRAPAWGLPNRSHIKKDPGQSKLGLAA